MSTEMNKALARREAQEIESEGNVMVAQELLTPHFQLHFPGFPTLDREGFKMMIAGFHAGFPDLQVTFQEQIAEGDRVTNRLTMRGTHRGAFQGIPPTGKSVTVNGINIMRMENGKIAEIWGALDVMGLMQQIGAVPMPEPAGM